MEREKTLKITSANSRGLDNMKIALIKLGFEKGFIDMYFLQEVQHLNLNKFQKMFGSEYEIAANPHKKWGTCCIFKKANKHRLEITKFNSTSYQGQKVIVKGHLAYICV